MKNNEIAKVLKAARKRNALSVKDVVCRLEDRSMYVAPKTLYGWENGQSQPSADTLLVLCEIYNIHDILKTFGYKNEFSDEFTDFEKTMIFQLRKRKDMVPAIKKLLDMS